MKQKRISVWLLILAFLWIPNAAAAEDDFDEYIVQTNAAVSLPCAGVERLAEGIYLVQSRALAEDIAGKDGIIEPNETVLLPDESFDEIIEAVSAPKGSADSNETALLQAIVTTYTLNVRTIEMMDVKLFHSWGYKGSGVRVAIIDSGFDRNGEFYYPPEYAGGEKTRLDLSRVESGHDYVDGGECLADPLQKKHGTSVAACVLAVAPEATIIPLRCFDAGGGSKTADLITAVNDAVTKYHCNVIHMSWGLKTNKDALYTAVRAAWEAGCVLVASSGNNEAKGTLFYPAAYEEVIGVGSVGSGFAISSFSVQSAAVSMCALGEGTVSKTLGSSSTSQSGTSFAAPLVSGTAAVLLGAKPELSNAEVMAELILACDDLGAEGYDETFGYGVLNPEKLFLLSARTKYNVMTVSGILRKNELLAAYTAEGQFCGLYVVSGDTGFTAAEVQYCQVHFRRAAIVMRYRLDDEFRALSEAEAVHILP